MHADLTAGIVRILRPDGATRVTGLFDSANSLIAIQSHVVQGEPSPTFLNARSGLPAMRD